MNYKKTTKVASSLLALALMYQSIDSTLSFQDSMILAKETMQKNYYYLSDLAYIKDNKFSYVGDKTFQMNQSHDNQTIQLQVQGKKESFYKGISAHAPSQIVYDLKQYSKTYPTFQTKLGVDASRNGNGSVIFTIYTTKEDTLSDQTKWNQVYKSNLLTSKDDAQDVSLSIKDCTYIRLVADSNGDKSADHAVYADAKIVKEGYVDEQITYNSIKPLAQYDQELKKHSAKENVQNHLHMVLLREFVNRMGYDTILKAVKYDETNTMNTTLDWLVKDQETLRLFIEAGNIKNPFKCLHALNTLYTNHKNDVNNIVYRKMILALAVAYSSDVIVSPLHAYDRPQDYDYDVDARYVAMKELYDNNKFLNKEEFNNYHIEFIRMIMHDSIANEEVRWLQGYMEALHPIVEGNEQKTKENLALRLNPFKHMAYVRPDYLTDDLYSEENRKKFNDKYLLDKYNVPYGLTVDGKKIERTWMSMEKGGICFNVARLGQNLNKTQGYPSVGVYQSGHEAFLIYRKNNKGDYIWEISNDITGWGASATSWYNRNITRLLFNWNNKSFADNKVNGSHAGNSSGYQILGQDALDHYDTFIQSFYYNLIANSYESIEDQIKVYKEALAIYPKNLDSYDLLIQAYTKQNASNQVWFELAKQVIKEYTFFPNAMVDVLKLIEPHLTTTQLATVLAQKQKALQIASDDAQNTSKQAKASKELAKTLLGTKQEDLATFAFDGDHANKIVINDRYKDNNFQLGYSVDGGKTYHRVEPVYGIITISNKHLQQINAQQDLYVRIEGSNEPFIIDIQAGKEIITNDYNHGDCLYAHDDENIIMKRNQRFEELEYSIDQGATWNPLTKDETFREQNNVLVRYMSKGTRMVGAPKTFTFTNKTNPTKQYIPIKHLSLVSANPGQGNDKPENMLDASPFTKWHTTYGQKFQNPNYIVKFDQARYLSEIVYDSIPSNGNDPVNGRLKEVNIYTSLDGTKYTQIAHFNDLPQTNDLKTFSIPTTLARYVKIEAIRTQGNSNEGDNKYISGRNFIFYEDTTKQVAQPNITYSTTNPTNQDVIATLSLPQGYTAISKQTHTFTQNGTFTFEYNDINGNKQTMVANVQNIDRIPPTAKVVYDITTPTNLAVTASLTDFSEDHVVILNGNQEHKHIFTENGTFTFEIQDLAGNKNSIVASVDWIHNNQMQIDQLKQQVKTKFESIQEKNYTPDSYKAVKQAYDAIQALASNASLEQIELTQTNFNQAYKQLQITPADKQPLKTLVDSLQNLLASDYTPHTWASFQTALDHAQMILKQEQPLQSEVEEALLMLQTKKDLLQVNPSTPQEQPNEVPPTQSTTPEEDKVEHPSHSEPSIPLPPPTIEEQTPTDSKPNIQEQGSTQQNLASQQLLQQATHELNKVKLLQTNKYTKESVARVTQAANALEHLLSTKHATTDELQTALTQLRNSIQSLVIPTNKNNVNTSDSTKLNAYMLLASASALAFALVLLKKKHSTK